MPFVDLVETVKPAVVSVRVRSDLTPQVASDDGGALGNPLDRFFRQFARPRQEERQAPGLHFYAQGSGFLISADGYIVANNHVVANAVKLQIPPTTAGRSTPR